MTTPPTPPTDNLAAEGGPRSEMPSAENDAPVSRCEHLYRDGRQCIYADRHNGRHAYPAPAPSEREFCSEMCARHDCAGTTCPIPPASIDPEAAR